jgi:fructose-1,6-bisphosphatase/inositol monophosphatase family enzyme/orotate phosphoribosyltransferase
MEAAQVDDVLSDLAKLLTGFIKERVQEPIGFVAGPKRGNSLLIRETARRLGRYSAFVKQQPLFGRWIEGPVDPGSAALVIDDVASDGELLLSTIERLRDEGHPVIAAVVLIDREEGDSRHLLGQHSVDFHYMMSASDDDLRRIRAEAARGFGGRRDTTDRLSIAENAAWEGARAIRHGWRHEGLHEAKSKTAAADVATILDARADEAIKAHLHSALDGPVILSEEDERGPKLPFSPGELWLIDPIDGSHNASIGIPVVGVAVAWARRGVVEGAVVVDVFGESSLAAEDGATRTRGPLVIEPPRERAVVALQQAYSTPRASTALAAVRNRLESVYARVLYTWCPVVDLLLTARGHMFGWVSIGLGGPEYEAIRFLSQRIGLAEHQLDDHASGLGTAHTFVVAWPQHLDALVDAASQAIKGDLA